MTWELEDSWEEVSAIELMDGDVVTHSRRNAQVEWLTVQSLRGPCVGWLVSGSDDYYVRGDVLFPDGTKEEADLIAVSSRYKYRVTKLKPKKDSRWPGTCEKCGKGTYTSCFFIEHDGPCK